MKTINNLIYGYIVGDSFGLSILKKTDYDNNIKLKFNDYLNIEKGSFSSMTTNMLATMDSISCNKKVDFKDIMNKLCTSLIVGKYTNSGKVYNLDNETLKILTYYSKKNNFNYELEENNTSSYAISRVLPIAIYNFYNSNSIEELTNVILLTSINEVVHIGCYIYYKYLLNIMEGKDKFKALKIKIPESFNKESIKPFKNLLKGKIYYKDINFNDNIINVLNVVFYVVLNSDNYMDMFNMISNLEGNTNIYSSLICSIGGIIYGKENIPIDLLKDLRNKKEINKYIKNFERVFL